MELDLIGILNNNGAEIKVDGEISFAEMEFGGTKYEFPLPLAIKGKIANVSGVLEFTAHVLGKASTFCDRCTKPVEIDVDYEIHENMVSEENQPADKDDVIVLDSSVINVDDIALNNFLTATSISHLCSPDCKGLCRWCGADKNVEDCACENKITDPRLEILDNLFKD